VGVQAIKPGSAQTARRGEGMIKAHSIALPSRSLADPKFKPVQSAQYTVADLRRTWRRARLINRMVKGAV